MTLLLIDTGNSRTKFGLQHARAYPPAAPPREAAQAAFGNDELAARLPGWLAALPAPPRAALGTQVAPRTAATIEEILARAGCRVAWVGAEAHCLGVANGYREPARLGADRWMAMVGLGCRQRQAAGAAPASARLLAHFGTATTLDTLSAGGRFEGGLILPGCDMMRRALAHGTAQLPTAQGRVADFPDNTHDAIATGVAAAQAGAVLRQWLAVRARHGQAPVLHACGGAWPVVEEEVRRLLAAAGSTAAIEVVDNPVLDGLAYLARACPDRLPAPF